MVSSLMPLLQTPLFALQAQPNLWNRSHVCCSKPLSLSSCSSQQWSRMKCRRNRVRKTKALEEERVGSSMENKEEEKDKDKEEEFKVVMAMSSRWNDIVIVDTPKSRLLLLDYTHNVHSVYNKGNKWTGAYWDDFASLPAIIPQGSIAILGLGGGTSAHLMLDVWPSLKLEGWEIDEILIDKAREYLGLADLEKSTEAGGVLCVHAGDALSPSAIVAGGFAGIVVDLFSGGKVLPQLEEVATWLELNDRLMPNGRIMVNCGGAHNDPALSLSGEWVQNASIKALCEAFPGNLSWKKMGSEVGENYLALTGPLPDLDVWCNSVPDKLKLSVKQWRPCELLASKMTNS